MDKGAEIERLEKELAAARYECGRWKDVAGKQASWETLWDEEKTRAEAAEASLTALRAHVGVLTAFIRTIAEDTWTSDKPGKARALLSATPPDAVKVAAVMAAAKEAYGDMTDYLCMQNPSFERLCAAVTDLTGEDKP